MTPDPHKQSSRQSDGARPIRLLINGARGRMGALIARLAGDDARFFIAAQRDHDGWIAGSGDPREPIDVIIDFSSDAGGRDACRLALERRAALLTGTTGMSTDLQRMLDAAAHDVAVLVAPNTSLGVAVLAHLAAEASRLLGRAFDIDIVELHHTRKKDAPSGTALRLARGIRERGDAADRLPDERIHALRAGDIIGEHVVHFAGPGERITLTHQATSRDLFARGALRAAAYLAGKPPGRYTIEQALGIE